MFKNQQQPAAKPTLLLEVSTEAFPAAPTSLSLADFVQCGLAHEQRSRINQCLDTRHGAHWRAPAGSRRQNGNNSGLMVQQHWYTQSPKLCSWP